MKYLTILLLSSLFVIYSCKKEDKEPENTKEEGSYPGKIKSINDNYMRFYYTDDGKIAKYDYNYYGTMKTATVTWESNQVICNDGYGFTNTHPFNSAGYALPEISNVNGWVYDSLNQVISLKGANYFWSNGNIDSIKFGSSLTIIEYTNDLDTRDFGANRIPVLSNFAGYNLNEKNLRSKVIQFDAVGDTSSVRLYTYTFDDKNRISSQLINIISNGDTSYLSLRNYKYYE